MKKILVIFSLTILITSCNKKDRYKGIWVFNNATSNYDIDTPMKLVITDDSIEVIRYDFIPSNKYAFQFKDNNLVIEDNLIKTEFIKGALIINERLKFFKDDSGKKSKEIGVIDPKIEINLPEIKTTKLIKYPKNKTTPVTYIRYGKRHDTGEFALQLNDEYTIDFNDLSNFLIKGKAHNGDNYSIKHNLFLDKNSRMKDLEKIFLIMSSVNALKIAFVNKTELILQDSLTLSYNYSILHTILPPLEYNYKYANSIFPISNGLIPVFDSDTTHPMFNSKPNNYPNIISLVRNKFYFNGIEFEKHELSKLLKEDLENKNHVLSLFDLESDYLHFLELKMIIRSTYNSFREEKSIKKYNKSLNDLKKEQIDTIKLETPIKVIWNYSIPHYKAIVKDGYGFFGMRVKPLNSIFPLKMDSISKAE